MMRPPRGEGGSLVEIQDLEGLPPTVSVDEAAEILGVSRSTAFDMAREFLATGEGLPVLRCGRRLRVPVPRLFRLLGLDPDGAGLEARPPGGSSHPDHGDAA